MRRDPYGQRAQGNVAGSHETLESKRSGKHGDPAQPGPLVNSAELVGGCYAFKCITETIRAIAARKCSVVIVGETGTGKELVARRIHVESDRGDKVFIPVDCATLTGQLFESQLFGHTKGAFTGAIDDTLGFFRAADGGTIFLDEIAEIPIGLQAKLLRVLQEEVVMPLGSTRSYPVDMRILCATNRDLQQLVRDHRFRPDLYYRLNVVTLQIPPLRERKEDIILLAEHFLARQADFYNEPPKALGEKIKNLLLEYPWPGNIRELANVMERAYVLSPSQRIGPEVLPPEIRSRTLSCLSHPAGLPTINAANRELIVQALRFTQGRKLTAARILGLERRRLNRLIDKLKISPSELRKKDTAS
jgi:DNA-binding NtrC family response regulator